LDETGRASKEAEYSPATLRSVRLELNENFVQWSESSSSYYAFYFACLKQQNPFALYVVSLKLGFRNLDLDGAISVLKKIQHTYPVATLLLIMLQSCAATLMEKNYWKFRDKYNLLEISSMSDDLMFHINTIGPKRFGNYCDTWHFVDFPHCWFSHNQRKEYNGERCMQCIYYYLSRNIMLLS